METIDIEAIESYAHIIQSQHRDMLNARASYIKEMYKILKQNGYTETVAIDAIHSTLCNKFGSFTEVTKEFIQKSVRKNQRYDY